MIAAIYKLNKDDFESIIMMDRLFHLLYIEIHNYVNGTYISVKLEHIFEDPYPLDHTQ